MRRSATVFRVGLLGAGYIADWHARALRSVPGAWVAAVCDRAIGRAEALAGRLGASAFGDLDAMLAGAKPDVVHVLLPPDLHFEATRRLLEAGVHVFLEKPMCVDPAEADALARLAESSKARLGVGHNFSFGEPYERLRDDLAAGWIGRPERIGINWRKPLEPARSGPFDLWMLRDPAHIVLEIGPHLVAHAVDLAACAGLPTPELADVRVSDAVDLPTGARFYRRWQADLDAGPARISLEMAFGPGFGEHGVHVRGTLGAAAVDFEQQTYVLKQHTPSDPDIDRYRATKAEGRDLAWQASRNFRRFAMTTLKLGRDGRPYEASIARAARSFYGSLATGAAIDRRLSAATGAEVIRHCAAIGGAAPRGEVASVPVPAVVADPSAERPGALVLGGTGFIGRALAASLLERGVGVRLLARNPARLPAALRGRPGLSVATGDTADADAMARAMEGVEAVYHLVVAHGKSWDEYVRNDVEPTRRIGEACVSAGVRRLVYTGTIDSLANGDPSAVITDRTPVDPRIEGRNKYARAKAAGERALLDLHRERGLGVVIARPGVVIGRGGNPFHVGVAKWPHEALCQFWGDGRNPLPLVLVRDVADGLARAGEAAGVDGLAFNLVGPPLLSARDYLAELERAAGVRFRTFETSPWRLYLGDLMKWMVKVAVRHPERPRPCYGDWASRTLRARYDTSEGRRLLGWEPVADRETLAREGIAEPVAEFLR